MWLALLSIAIRHDCSFASDQHDHRAELALIRQSVEYLGRELGAMEKIACAVRHVSFEDLGCFEAPLRARGYSIRYINAGVDDLALFDGSDSDLIVILGGPIGAYDEAVYPFLTEEFRIIQARLQARRPLMGICLGAQLIARSLGSRVYPGPTKEIGFAPVTLTEAGKNSCLSSFDQAPVLHWHGDTFDLPEGATLLASSPNYRNQAYSYGSNVIAFQFHAESVASGFERWLIGHACELSFAGVDLASLRGDFANSNEALRERAVLCLEEWLNQIRPDEFQFKA